MHRILSKAEIIVDKLIPYLLVGLIIIIGIEIFFPVVAETYPSTIQLADNVVIGFFIVDLAFKYRRAKNVSEFIKSNWVDIIAVIPFYLFFRVMEEFVLVSNVVKEGQEVAHVASGIENGAACATKELRNFKMITRSESMTREIRVLERMPRLLKAVHFFEKPKEDHSGSHTSHKS